MRRIRAIGLAATTALVLACGAASTAQAAPTVTVAPWCDEANYGIAATMSGFPPDTQIGATIASDPLNVGPAFFTTDSAGNSGPHQVGSGAPMGHVTVTVFEDLNGNEVQDSGEPVFSGSADQPCGQRPLDGGNATGSAAGTLDDGTSIRLDLDAHSGAQGANPGGTVTDTRNGTSYTGTVTCVAVRRQTAAIGVRFDSGGPGGTPAEVVQASEEDLVPVAVQAVAQAPGPEDCPLPGDVANAQLIGLTSNAIHVTTAAGDTTPPVIHGAGPVVTDATTRRGAWVRLRGLYATDDTDANPQITCSPPSGARFRIGTTAVTCTATDSAGNRSTASLTVRVLGARGQIAEQRALVAGGSLPKRDERRLTRSLDRARRALNHGRPHRACSAILRYERDGRALAGDGLTSGQATNLVVAGDRIRTVLGCLPDPLSHGARMTLTPACDPAPVDAGGGSYGVSVELARVRPSSTVGLEFSVGDGTNPSFVFDVTAGPDGHVAPWLGAQENPPGDVTVVAFRDRNADQVREPGERAIARRRLADLCAAVPRPRGTRVRRR